MPSTELDGSLSSGERTGLKSARKRKTRQRREDQGNLWELGTEFLPVLKTTIYADARLEYRYEKRDSLVLGQEARQPGGLTEQGQAGRRARSGGPRQAHRRRRARARGRTADARARAHAVDQNRC